MQMEPLILGIDVAKATLDTALMNAQIWKNKQFENTPAGYQQIEAWLKRLRGTEQVHICLEATGQYGDGVAKYLHEQGYLVSVVNPARIKHYANSKLRRNKTDKADAQLIAEYCEKEKPALWTPPPASFKDLQALVRHLDGLLETRQQETNRLVSGVQTFVVVESLKSLITFLDDQIQKTKQAIQEHINSHPDLALKQSLLISIPGIGDLTAARLLGEVRNILDFEDARQLAAYAGLTPRNVFSGSSVHKKSRLSKTGNANLRKALYMPAISAKHWNPIVSQFCARLSQNGLRPKEVIGAAMRKLLHIAFGVLKSGQPFDPDFLVKTQALS
jgi:transposase